MKINNKLIKIFFIFLFFIFIFLFFNINECLSYSISYSGNYAYVNDFSSSSQNSDNSFFEFDFDFVFIEYPNSSFDYSFGTHYFDLSFIEELESHYSIDVNFSDFNKFIFLPQLYSGTKSYSFYFFSDFSISYNYKGEPIIDFPMYFYVSFNTVSNKPVFALYTNSGCIFCDSSYNLFSNCLDILNVYTSYVGSVNYCSISSPFGSILPPTPTQNYTLYIDDCNFMKRFKFEFKVPLIKEDTKVFCFLEDYTRNSYDSVTGTFKFYTVSTPEDYDYTDYKNYMYYDAEDKKLYLPAGCYVQCYSCIATNGELYEIELFNEYFAERNNYIFSETNHFFSEYLFTSMAKEGVIANYSRDEFNEMLNSGYVSNFTEYLRLKGLLNETSSSLSFLFPTDTEIDNFNYLTTVYTVVGDLGISYKKNNLSTGISFNSLLNFLGFNSLDYNYFSNVTHLLYYSWRGADIKNIENFSDFAFSTCNIPCYENEKNPYNKSGYIYDLYRNTNVYNQNNKINNFTYFINYSDNQDVTSMLPEGTDSDYLSSPLLKDNENSSSGGYITYDIQEVIQGDKVIDYSKEDNSIHNNINNTYIENWVEGDNINITKDDNSSIDKILKTSEDILGILRLLYTSVLNIEAKMQNLADNISNTTNNFSYNVKNEINRIVVPNSAIIKDKFTTIKTQSEEHLGIMYQGVDFLMFVGTLYAELDDPEVIVLNIPEISLYDHVLIKETTFNFTNFMTEDLPFLSTIHNIYLTAVDLVFLCILIKFAEKVYDKYTGNGGN